MDSASFFRDKSLGADSPISVSYIFTCWDVNVNFYISKLTASQGLISLLAAVDALASLSGFDDFPKQVNFDLVLQCDLLQFIICYSIM